MVAIAADIFMLHVLQVISKHFQWMSAHFEPVAAEYPDQIFGKGVAVYRAWNLSRYDTGHHRFSPRPRRSPAACLLQRQA